MARKDQSHPSNVAGPWFVDTRCISCDVARHWAPGLIGTDEQGRSFVTRQPADTHEEAALWRAAEACPTKSIGNVEIRRPPEPPFPYELTPGVYATGHNAPSSFGAHSYLVVRTPAPGTPPAPQTSQATSPPACGNILVDAPVFHRSLAQHIDTLGGISHIFLTHRDDVADATQWADRYNARVWIHEADADAAPFATDIMTGTHPTEIAPSAFSIPVPGHTRGHTVLHIDNKWLFTGDTLYWNRRHDQLDVFPQQTWYSWEVLSESMDRLAKLQVEWVFPGHGKWHHTGLHTYTRQMARLGQSMRETGQARWSAHRSSVFNRDPSPENTFSEHKQ